MTGGEENTQKDRPARKEDPSLTHPLLFHFRPQSTYAESRIEIDTTHRPHNTAIDVAESEYRSRVQPNYRKEFSVTGTTVDGPGFGPNYKSSSIVDEYTVDGPSARPKYKESVHVTGSTVDAPAPRSTYHKEVNIIEETVDASRYASPPKKSKMGYYDEDGKHCALFFPSQPQGPPSKPTTSVLTPYAQATTTRSVRDCTSWLTVLCTLKAMTALRSVRSARSAAPAPPRARAPPTR